MSAIVGIDLGTTNSLVAHMRDGAAQTLPNELDEHVTPSAVAVAEDGALLVGRSARDRLVVSPGSGRVFFKRDMGTGAVYRFGGRDWTPTQCSAAILREMRRVAELRLGQEIRRAVVTVPAYFHEPQRQATVTAAEIAGLVVERILNEPTAAALAHGYESPLTEKRLVVLDLGGGTFDVSAVDAFAGVIEIRASAGDSRLGGEDFTDALLQSVLERLGKRATGSLRERVRHDVELAKRRLSTSETTLLSTEVGELELTRTDLEQASRRFLARIRPLLRRCLRDARFDAAELDDILLVGGASRMPVFRTVVETEFGRPPSDRLDPDRIVALGAAVQAAACGRDAAVRDVILTDVCPHTLGIEVTKEFRSGHFVDGFFAPIIERNITVPVSREETFHTLTPQQDKVEIRIFQGESRRIENNTLLGELRVKGLRALPEQRRPGEFEVRFSYDMNGILEVEVTICESGERTQKVIETRPGAMTREEIAEAVRRLQPLKVRPRDLLPNRARIERGYRMYEMLKGPAREELSGALDQFESALERGDGEDIGFARAALDQILARYRAVDSET